MAGAKAKAKADPKAKALFPVTDLSSQKEKASAREGTTVLGLGVKGNVRAKANALGKMDIQFVKDPIVRKIVTKDIIPTKTERAIPIIVTILLRTSTSFALSART